MKVAIRCESPYDQQAVRVLVDAILGRHTSVVELDVHSWPIPDALLRTVVVSLYYRGEADGLVVVVDSDSSPPHQSEHDHDEQGGNDDGGPSSHAAEDSTRSGRWRERGLSSPPWPGGSWRW